MTMRYQYRLRGALEEPINSRSKGSATLDLPPEIPTLPALLKGAGYHTALIGKWHPDYPLDGVSLSDLLRDPTHHFERPLHWRMNHRGQRALREGDWKYLMVDGFEYLFNIPAGERERWLAWNAGLPPIPEDATISLGCGAKDLPQR